MYVITNAFKNLGRNKGRNILIAAIIFMIISTTVVALIINNTASAVIDNYENQFASEVTISPDMNKVREQAQAAMVEGGGRVMLSRPELSPEQLLAFMESAALKESIAYASTSASSDQIKAIDQSEADDANDQVGPPDGAMISGGGNSVGAAFMIGGGGDFRLYGDYFVDFDEGNRSLTDGSSMPRLKNEALISADLAEENDLKVGDIITMSSNMRIDLGDDFDAEGKADGDTIKIDGIDYTLSIFEDTRYIASREVTYDLKVVGIYDDLTDEYPDPNMPAFAGLNRRNEVLTTFDTLMALRQGSETGVEISVTYYLQSPDLLDKFISDVKAMGLTDDFIVSTNSAAYEQTVRPVQSMKNLSLAFIGVVVVLGCIILLLLTSISIRERKYEIGVLRAMGMKKGTVALGLWTELLIITLICLVLGIGVGALVAQPITDVLINQQVNAQLSENSSNQNRGFGGPGGGPVSIGGSQGPGTRIVGGGVQAQPLTEMDVSLSLVTLAQIVLLALALATVAGLVSISRITKYEPIKILMERN